MSKFIESFTKTLYPPPKNPFKNCVSNIRKILQRWFVA